MFFCRTILSLCEQHFECCDCTLSCLSCFDDIIKSGSVGCSGCYEKFYHKLQPSIQRIHGKAKHTGKAPKNTNGKVERNIKTTQEKIDGLHRDMQKAIDMQNFEQAAVIRDEIKKLKGEQ